MRRRTTRIVGVASLLCALASAIDASGAEPTPALDADNVVEATSMVATGARILEKAHTLCSEHFPDRRRELDYAYIMWRERNTTELQAVVAGGMADSKIAEAAAVAGLLRLKALDATKLEAYCQGYAAQLPQGLHDISARTPKAARLLAQLLRDKPLSEHQARAIDFEMGCLKSSFNKGIPLDSTQQTCRCSWNAMNATFSPEEWREYEAAASASRDVTQLPQVKRAMPKLAACAKP